MTTEGRQNIANSRALYFSDFTNDSDSSETSTDDGKRKPSYVGLSHAINGYTQYAPYNGRVKKLSPPIQIPVSPPQTLDSVTLVLSQDSYQKSVTEFENVMRDLSNTSLEMGRPERNTDITDSTAPDRCLITNGDNFFPKTHSKQIINDGDKKSVEIVTKFHSDGEHSPTYSSPMGSKQNLVQKQIERLYGDTFCQVRMTSPEPRDSPERNNGSTPDSSNGHDLDNQDSLKSERKLSGGFFAKRFGISKMKDHSTRKLIDTNSSDNSPLEFKPLKVPAVFRLLRPEFREQLKQSSCKIAIPLEEGPKQERIIPIRREGEPEVNGSTPASRGATPTKERVVPISVIENSPKKVNHMANGINNNNSEKTPNSDERVIPIRRESGDITATPKRPVGLAPKVNGFSPTKQASIMGLRNGTNNKPAVVENKNGKQEAPNGKQNIVRKLSPLSPKHIVGVPSSEKPAPMPKPEHLKSPPMSPIPAGSASSPPPHRQNTPATSKPSTPPKPLSPTPTKSKSPVPEAGPKVEKLEKPGGPPTQPETNSAQNGTDRQETQHHAQSKPLLSSDTTITTVSTEVVNNNHKECEVPLDDSYEEYDRNGEDYDQNSEVYPEEFYYDNPPCGLRERELLCPIMEEDNESTASGSIQNLAAHNNAVIGGVYSPDDPLLISEQGEVQDGHYFLKVLENEIFKFEEQICDFEEDLNNGANIPDDVRDSILTVVGMAKLLMAQKLTQFRGLCDKNINVTREEDPFVPTCQDLAGFWDMVHIQVEQIHKRFDDLIELKKMNWVVKAPEVVKNNKTKGKKVNLNKPIKPKAKSEAALARDEARKKMLEERKRLMKEKSQKKEEDDVILIM